MIRSISSRLSAPFQVDGSHLNRYLRRESSIRNSMVEELVLHDQVLIPTPDFLTAAGLISILGERAVLELLESERLRFIRTRNCFGYVRGTGPDGGLAVFSDPEGERPQDCDVDQSIHAGLGAIRGQLGESARLERLLAEGTFEEKTGDLIDSVRSESIQDLRASELWTPEFDDPNPDLLRLPGMTEMQVRVFGSGDSDRTDAVNRFLAYTSRNIDFSLAAKYCCQNINPLYPIGDFLKLKTSRLEQERVDFAELLQLVGVPDFADSAAASEERFLDFLRISESQNAVDFREWFHALESFDTRDVAAAYIEVLHSVPWSKKLPTRSVRFAVTTLAAFVPIVGTAASLFDAFIFDTVFREKSPRYFIDDLTKFRTSD